MLSPLASRRVLSPLASGLAPTTEGGAASPLLTGLVAGWHFDESSGDAADCTVGGRTLTAVNGATYTTGKLGNAGSLTDGLLQQFTRTSEAALQAATYDLTGFTFSIWVFPVAGTLVPINKRNGGTAEYHLNIANVGWYVFNTVGGSVSSYVTRNLSAWNHYVVGFDPSTRKAWSIINGSVRYLSTALTGNLRATAEIFQVGMYPGLDGTMLVDECYLWGRSLEDSDAALLWNSGNGLAYPFA